MNREWTQREQHSTQHRETWWQHRYADVSIVIASHNTAVQPELLKGLIKRFYIIQLILQSNTIGFSSIWHKSGLICTVDMYVCNWITIRTCGQIWIDLSLHCQAQKYYSRGHTTEKRTYTKQKCPDTNKRQIIIINTRLTEPTRSVPFTIPSSCFTLRLHLLPGTLQNNLHQTSYLSFKFKWGSHKKVQVTDSFCWYKTCYHSSACFKVQNS